MTEPIDVVLSGAGSNGAAQDGALSEVRSALRVDRLGGASAGAVNAIGAAADLDADRMRDVWEEFLTRGDLEDYHYPGPFKLGGLLTSKRWGLMAGQRVYGAFRSVLGEIRMSELRRPCRVAVGDLQTRTTRVLCAQYGMLDLTPTRGLVASPGGLAYRHVFAADAARASSGVPFLFDAWPLVPGGKELYTDGGTGGNTPRGVWDDYVSEKDLRPLCVIRMVDDTKPRQVTGIKSFAASIFSIRQAASNAAIPILRERRVLDITIPATGDGLDFSLSKQEVRRRRAEGVEAARRALDRWR